VSNRAASWLAWALWAVTFTLVAGGLILGLANRQGAPLYEFWVVVSLMSPTCATLGALIVSRRPGNVIGWIFCISSVAGGIQMLSGQYATVTLFSETSSLPGGAVAAWLSTLMQILFVSSIFFLVLLFPTGRLLSPRWRVVAWTGGLVLATWVISRALHPGPLEDFPSAENPFSVEAATVLDTLGGVGSWIGPACFVAAIVSLTLRLYRSRGEERLQLKWFVYAATLGFLAIVLGGEGPFGTLVWTLAFLSLPVSAAIAVLKYRLYDIDLVINRTLVYASLTAILVGVYFGGVAATQAIFRALTGQQEQPQLAIVVSTLVIAALFNPLRHRIQSFIDRRFYRRKYDARKTLEAFSAKLRNETDLDALSGDLVEVVRKTMQPAHVSLWLRPDTAAKKDQKPAEG
jgi:hypothetical protein